MTLFIDQNEPLSIELLLTQSLPVERMLLNKPANPPRPDYWFLARDGRSVGVSRKQGGEFLGDIDACEAQLLVEMGGCDFMALLIEGWWEPTVDGKTRSWRYGRTNQTAHPQHTYHQNGKGVRAKLARLQDLGIMIIQTANEVDTALSLVALYDVMQKAESEHQTFKRLIRERYYLDETDTRKKSLALFLMGLDGVGEEVAMALAGEFPSFASLYSWLAEPDGERRLAIIPMGSGKRMVGPSVVKRMKGQLGL